MVIIVEPAPPNWRGYSLNRHTIIEHFKKKTLKYKTPQG